MVFKSRRTKRRTARTSFINHLQIYIRKLDSHRYLPLSEVKVQYVAMLSISSFIALENNKYLYSATGSVRNSLALVVA